MYKICNLRNKFIYCESSRLIASNNFLDTKQLGRIEVATVFNCLFTKKFVFMEEKFIIINRLQVIVINCSDKNEPHSANLSA